MNPSRLQSSFVQVSNISRCDRWQAHQRLQDLDISCQCSTTGQLEVEINGLVTALQVRSVVQQFTASRPELIDWLERCWQRETLD